MINMADVSLIDAIRMITSTPARIMKVSDKKGSLAAGKDADILIFNEEINIKMTMVKGRVVYERD
jgi:N-acetylglucosamine-6-phosphate deacetylase